MIVADQLTWLLKTNRLESLASLNAAGLSARRLETSRSSVAALALNVTPWLTRIAPCGRVLWSAWWSAEWISCVGVLVLGVIKVSSLEDYVGSVGLLWSTTVDWDGSEGDLVLSQSPFRCESLLRCWNLVETLGVVPEPEEELEVLRRTLNPLHVVHEVTNSAWLLMC